jgi:hypothetical protein
MCSGLAGQIRKRIKIKSKIKIRKRIRSKIKSKSRIGHEAQRHEELDPLKNL